MAEEVDTTHDALLRGRLVLRQPRSGYRVNVDALWLAGFARAPSRRPSRRALDLGAGVGAVGLTLLLLGAADGVTLLEVDPTLASLARDSAEASGLSARVEVVTADVSQLPPRLRGSFGLVVANPPYFASRPSPVTSRARARTGDPDTLPAFVRAARAALGKGGRACFVFPARDLARLLATLRGAGLEPKRMQLVHPLPDAPASVALVEAKPGRGGGLAVEPPLFSMDAPGRWSERARRILDGDDLP